MAQSLKRIKQRIRSVQSIKKITRAMEMVSFAKLNQTYKDIYSAKEYLACLQKMVGDLLSGCEGSDNPFIKERINKKRILLCVISSDNGLCGNYNNEIIHIADDFIKKNGSNNTDLFIIGKKAYSHFKRTSYHIINSYTDCYGHYSAQFADKVSNELIDAYLSGKADEVYIAYASFISSSRHSFIVEKILNISKKEGKNIDYIFEPDSNGVLERVLPLYIRAKIRAVILNAFATEHSTRVMAMGEATQNAEGLLEDLVLIRNRVRQAGITTEITEVVSASEALK